MDTRKRTDSQKRKGARKPSTTATKIAAPKQTPVSSPAAKGKIRYAVVGLGYIAQIAVLPAFAHAGKNSELTALVSDDPLKLKRLGRKYNVTSTYSYDQYDACLKSGEIDAVYIALPNNMHREYTERAARAGVHVLCEKPMAVTVRECEAMIEATEQNRVKLMIAYRLHFEEANLKAAEIVNRAGSVSHAFSVRCSRSRSKPATFACKKRWAAARSMTWASIVSMPRVTCFATSRPRCSRIQQAMENSVFPKWKK